jgi:hypothetical protein
MTCRLRRLCFGITKTYPAKSGCPIRALVSDQSKEQGLLIDGTSGCITEFRTKTGVLFAFLMLCRRAHTNVGIMQPPPGLMLAGFPISSRPTPYSKRTSVWLECNLR